jgi:MFS transporter, Spinster family, sphingosine-1-phosphate transporter
VEQASEAAASESAPPAPTEAPPADGKSRPVGGVPDAPRWAWSLLLLLCAMNLFDSIDRWLLAALLPKVRLELDLSESQAGWLSTVTVLGLAITSPLVGYFVDRIKRPRLLAIGFAVWSLATISTALVRTFDQMQAARALVGVGGAISTVIALTLIMDLFARSARAGALTAFFLAVPLGAAMAVSFGAALAKVTTWQVAFLAVAAPGLILALLSLVFPDPIRGFSEGIDLERLRLHERVGASQEDYTDLMVNSSYTYSLFGITFSSFAFAGLFYWSKAFLTVSKGFSVTLVDSLLGVTVLGAAVAGTLAGGLLAGWSARTKPKAMFVVPGASMLVAIMFVLVAIYARPAPLVFGGLCLAIGVMFMNVVPCYTIISSVTMPNMRGVGCGAALAAVHLLGDIWSPTAMGWVADTFGQRDSMATGFGRALAALGATPVTQPGLDPQNLTGAMLVVVPALVIAGIVLLAGSRHLQREMALLYAKLRARPSILARNRRPQPPR